MCALGSTKALIGAAGRRIAWNSLVGFVPLTQGCTRVCFLEITSSMYDSGSSLDTDLIAILGRRCAMGVSLQSTFCGRAQSMGPEPKQRSGVSLVRAVHWQRGFFPNPRGPWLTLCLWARLCSQTPLRSTVAQDQFDINSIQLRCELSLR